MDDEMDEFGGFDAREVGRRRIQSSGRGGVETVEGEIWRGMGYRVLIVVMQ